MATAAAAVGKVSSEELVEVVLSNLHALLRRNDPAVLEAADKALLEYPSHKKILKAKGDFLLHRGSPQDLTDAAAIAEEILAVDSQWPDAFLLKGSVLTLQLKFSEAESVLRKGELLCGGIRTAALSAALGRLAKMRLESVTVGEAVAEAGEAAPAEAVPAEGGGASGGEADKFDGLEGWLASDTDHNTSFPKLYMKKYMEGNRGVHCREDVPPETEIMAIDRKFLITVEMGRACSIGRKMQAANPPLIFSASKHCYTTVFICMDMLNQDSFFQPYYRILPEAFPNMPLFWSDEQLQWLQGSYLLQQVEDRKANIKRDYEQIIRVAPEFKAIADLHTFMWVRMIVASRNFGVTIDGRKTDAMVPYADMLNHYRPRETKWTYNSARQCFTITSTTRLAKGQQVYDSYGKKCNSRFLLNYGFAVEHNRDDDTGQNHNEVRIIASLEAPGVDPWFQQKVSHLLAAGVCTGSALNSGTSREGIPWRAFRVSTYYAHAATREIFSWLRFAFATQEQLLMLPAITRDTDFAARPVTPVSAENEILVLRKLADLMAEQYSQYGSTLEDDIRELASGKHAFGSNRRNALVVIKGEKEVCRYYMALADICIPMLNSSYAEQAARIDKEFAGSDDLDKYVRSAVRPLLRQKDSQAKFAAGTGSTYHGSFGGFH